MDKFSKKLMNFQKLKTQMRLLLKFKVDLDISQNIVGTI